MNIYIYLYILLMFCFTVNNKTFKNALFYILSFIMLWLGAFRAKSVGTDTGAWYYSNWVFTTFNPNTWNKFTPMEPGYNLFMAFTKEYISNSYWAVYGLTFLIGFSVLIYVIKRYSTNSAFSLLILYIFCIYTSYYNIMRQTLAMSFCLLLIMLYITQRIKLIVYILGVCLVAFLIHGTCFFYCFVPCMTLLSKKNISKKILYSVLAVSLFLFINKSVINNIILYSSSLLSARYFFYVEWGQQLDSNYSLLEMLMYMAFTAVCIFFHKGNRFSELFYIYFIGVVMRASLINVVPIVGRVCDLMFVMSVFFVPNISNSLLGWKKYVFVCIVLGIGSIVFFNSLSHNYGEIIPYKTIF